MIFSITHRNTSILISLVLLFCFLSCSSDTSPKEIANRKKIKEGVTLAKDCDLIVRTGRSFVSSVLRRFSLTDQTYSHCGIVRIAHGKKWVYHAIGGEQHPKAAITKESIKDFCDPKNNIGFAIFRYRMTEKQKSKIDRMTQQYYLQKVPFDMQFDLNTDRTFYCSEFIYKTITAATDSSYLPTSQLKDFQYVAIDNLYLNPNTQKVYQAVFQ